MELTIRGLYLRLQNRCERIGQIDHDRDRDDCRIWAILDPVGQVVEFIVAENGNWHTAIRTRGQCFRVKIDPGAREGLSA